MTPTSHTPQAEWKVDEAEFFLSRLRSARPTAARRDAPAFSFYLSAFLNAAYSCREVLRLEVLQGKLLSRDAFARWQAAWVDSLDDVDARTWSLGLDERHREVHQRGAKRTPESGLVAMKWQQLFRGGIYGNIVTGPSPIPTGPLRDDEAAAALAGVVPLQFATIQRFEDERGQLEVVETCARYIRLLRRHVADCQRSITSRESKETK